MGKGNFRHPPPPNRHPQPITKTFVTGDYVGDPYGCAKLGAYPSTGDFWAHGWNITKIIFIYAPFVRKSPTGQTRRRIFTYDGSENLKIAISWPRFDRFWQNLARRCNSTLLNVTTVKILKFRKSNMAVAAILKNRNIAIFRLRFNRFSRNLARWCSSTPWPFRPLKI